MHNKSFISSDLLQWFFSQISKFSIRFFLEHYRKIIAVSKQFVYHIKLPSEKKKSVNLSILH